MLRFESNTRLVGVDRNRLLAGCQNHEPRGVVGTINHIRHQYLEVVWPGRFRWCQSCFGRVLALGSFPDCPPCVVSMDLLPPPGLDDGFGLSQGLRVRADLL